MTYFSERERGELPRDNEVISYTAWRGILAKIQVLSTDGSFGATYPVLCEDGTYVVGANLRQFDYSMRAEIPRLESYAEQDGPYNSRMILQVLGSLDYAPSTLDILDLIEFCWNKVSKPIKINSHSFWNHYHLAFDVDEGRGDFRSGLETIFRRNGIAYQLTAEGRIERLLDPVQREALVDQNFDTGDSDLDQLLSSSLSGFLSARPEERMDALLKLWDAWERLKTIDGPGDKAVLIKAMLDATAGTESPKLAGALDREGLELTWIGNNLRIRHWEVDRERLARSEHVDYLFHRMFSLIQLILRLR